MTLNMHLYEVISVILFMLNVKMSKPCTINTSAVTLKLQPCILCVNTQSHVTPSEYGSGLIKFLISVDFHSILQS